MIYLENTTEKEQIVYVPREDVPIITPETNEDDE